jgi:Mrp family chromosome partitioning ATPase
MDGVVLVVERGKTRKHELQAAVKYLANLKASFIGCVVDRAEVDWNVQLYQNQPKAKKITV